MTLVADVTLARGTYAAAGADPVHPEKIPSPYRLFCALVAMAAHTGAPRDNPALKWLARQAPPSVSVPPVLDEGANDSFVVTNARAKSGSTTHAARTNNARRRAWVNFRGDGFKFLWDTTPDHETFDELQRMARSITYIGRVESHARVSFTTAHTSSSKTPFITWEPVDLSQPGTDLAVPFAGALSALADAHDRGDPAWTTARHVRYQQQHDLPKSVVQGPFGSLVTFAIPGVPLGSESLLDATVGLRAAVMSRVADVVGEDRIPASVHGHVRDTTHLAFLALPFVDHPHADGEIRGLALAVPTEMPRQDRAILGQALTPGPASTMTGSHGHLGLTQVSLPRGGRASLKVEYQPVPTTPWAIQSDRWTGGTRGDTRWTAATPLMLGKYPKKAGDIDCFVAQACVQAGYPEPIAIRTSASPLLAGSAMWQRHYGGLLKNRPRRPTVYATLEFAQPVVGPVVIGSLRYLGLGLFAPQSPKFGAGPRTTQTRPGGRQ